MQPFYKYRVVAAGQNSADETVAFVTLSNKMSKEAAEAYLAWVEAGPHLKWLIEKELYTNAAVTSVVFCLDTE